MATDTQSGLQIEKDDSSKPEVGFVLSLGRALHTYGYPAHRLEEMMGRMSVRFGLQGQFFSTPTSIFASFGAQDDQRTYLMRVTPGEVNLGKLTELDDVIIGVLRHATSPETGSQRIEQIVTDPPRYGNLLMTIAFGLASASASRFLGGGLKEVVVSALIGVFIGLLSILTGRFPAVGGVFEPLAAFSASALAAGMSFMIGPYAVSNSMLGGLIVLMPGLTLTVAMIELSTQHLSSGTARLSKAFVVFLGMGFGVALANSLIKTVLGDPRIAKIAPMPSWTMFAAMILMPLSLTIILRAHKRDAIWIVTSGVLAVAGSRIGANLLGPEIGVFLGALIVGIAGSIYSRYLDHPSIVTQVPGILMLVPGSVGFRGLAALLDEKVVSGIDTTFKMILTAVALVAGTLIAGIIAPSRREA